MAIIRWILGRIILIVDFLTTPRGVKRPADQQAVLDAQTARLSLYQYKACPFCVKVRRAAKRQSLKIETRDAKNDPLYRQELQDQGGKLKVPCLRIESDNGDIQWMYESGDIVRYLDSVAA
ncbi:glutaredoxin [Marinobacterium nitratireducens]|uniref:Glutaredoxin n=1 Tax=Marinobacterium nitratireducens TaxID=518897 RepID=A0A918DY27_9GAMM|nr:glutaredoxin domain-containing protein [Marinobacterium nitratireducens]GGO88146.1 glutaredoxin [Marinobacterium nitratireducens]